MNELETLLTDCFITSIFSFLQESTKMFPFGEWNKYMDIIWLKHPAWVCAHKSLVADVRCEAEAPLHAGWKASAAFPHCWGEIVFASSLVFREGRKCPGSRPGRAGWGKGKKPAGCRDSWWGEPGVAGAARHRHYWMAREGGVEAEANGWWDTACYLL